MGWRVLSLDMRRFLRITALCGAVALAAAVPGAARGQSEPRVADLLASADQAWAARKYDDAFSAYQAVLRRDSTAGRAVFRMATLLGWRNDLDHSVSLFRLYLRLMPADEDGRIGLARTLAWRGNYDEAIAICDGVLASNPRERDAALLGAQAVAWSGKLQQAIARYEGWLSTHAQDADAWVALAQVWRWAGRPEETRQALRHAVAEAPNNADARVQLEWADVALSASFEPTITTTDDSDDNRATTYVMGGGLASPWSARLLANASYRVADFGAEHGTSAALRASSSLSPMNGRWTLRGEAGAVRLDASSAPGAPDETRLLPLLSARLSGHLSPAISLGGSVTRAAFDETASLMLAGIATTSMDADADVTLRPRLGIGGGASWTHLSGGSGPNSRLAGSGSLRWSATKFASIAATVRGFEYDHAAFDGYFAPKRYLLAEMSGRLHLGGELGWGLDSELGLGDQTIVAFDDSHVGRFAQRVSVAIAYRPAPGLEWSLSGGFANVASPTTISSADYRAYTLSLKGRVRL